MIDLRAVGLVDPHGQRVGDPVLLQVDHRLPHFLFFFHLGADLHGLPLADPLDLGKAFRLLLHDAEGVSAKFFHDAGSEGRPHPPDGAGAQIAFDALLILKNGLHIAFHLKLAAVHGMLHIASVKLQPLALIDGLEASHTGDLLSLSDQLKNGVAVLRIPVYDMLHIAGYLLHLTSPASKAENALLRSPSTGRL